MPRSLRGWRLARIHGVDLKIHVSLVFLLAYVVLVAAVQFPSVVRLSGVDPAGVSGGPSLWGLIFAIALFVSITLHEFGHVLVAQSMGVKVKGVTLMMLGGVSEMERIPEERYAELKVAIIGPLVSLALGGGLLALSNWVSSPDLRVFSYWLGRVNIALAVFNLIPAFPLDGGRAFRSWVAAHRGNQVATRVSVNLGRGLALLLGLLGLLGGNLILVLIAFFVYSAASQELLVSSSREAIQGVPAGRIGLRIDPISSKESLIAAAHRMMTTQSRLLPVSDAGVLGVLSADRLRSVPRRSWAQLTVADIFEPMSQAVDVSQDLNEVLPELTTAGALLLQENGRVVGVIRHKDLQELIELRDLECKSRPAS